MPRCAAMAFRVAELVHGLLADGDDFDLRPARITQRRQAGELVHGLLADGDAAGQPEQGGPRLMSVSFAAA
jgi:hypothetical protein